MEFLYSHGSIYLARNGNLLFHGCVPMTTGTVSSMNCMGTWRAGKDYLDFCDRIARKAWRDRNQEALDWMWYLWIGFKSPIWAASSRPSSAPISMTGPPGRSPWTPTSS